MKRVTRKEYMLLYPDLYASAVRYFMKHPEIEFPEWFYVEDQSELIEEEEEKKESDNEVPNANNRPDVSMNASTPAGRAPQKGRNQAAKRQAPLKQNRQNNSHQPSA
jgi:hypothetical protein